MTAPIKNELGFVAVPYRHRPDDADTPPPRQTPLSSTSSLRSLARATGGAIVSVSAPFRAAQRPGRERRSRLSSLLGEEEEEGGEKESARPSAASGPSRVRRPSRPAGPASINLAIGASGTADTPVIGPKPDLGGAARGDRERPPALLARRRGRCTPRVRAAPRSFADRPAARPRRRPKERRRVRHRRSAA
ncbi:hypothetical protein MTO96_002923 [Rhipicephalus appendiculatus]